MPYIGNQPGTGVRSRFIYTATASQTTFTGADDNSKTLKYADSAYVDVFLNGVCLVPGTDYTASTKTSIVLTQAASLNDTLEVVAYDIASMSDMSASNGGTFQADVTFAAGADLITASAGTDNVRLGENAGAAIASGGDQNTLIGKDAGTAITTGDRNTLVGATAGDAIVGAELNTAVGYGALHTETEGDRSTAVGAFSLSTQNTTGGGRVYNTAVGYGAGNVVTTGVNNTLIGGLAGVAITTGDSNTAVGRDALGANTTADNNTAVGYQAMVANTTGISNTAVGSLSLDANTTGNSNTAVGRVALTSNTTGVQNVAMGVSALEANTTGEFNVAIGNNSLAVANSSHNIGIGYNAGVAVTSGVQNILIGSVAGDTITSGSENVCIGMDAGEAVGSSGRNTLIGDQAGHLISGGSNTVIGRFTGNNDGLDIRTHTNQIVLSNGSGQPRMHIDGSGNAFFGSYTTNTNTEVSSNHIVGSGSGASFFTMRYNGSQIGDIAQSGTTGVTFNTSSDYRLKENVVYDWDATTRLKQLKPARFNFIADADRTVDGFLAHEAAPVVPEAVTGVKDAVDDDGNAVMQGIDQSKLVPLLVKTIQELEARITVLEG